MSKLNISESMPMMRNQLINYKHENLSIFDISVIASLPVLTMNRRYTLLFKKPNKMWAKSVGGFSH